jgi:hypothetical protein
MPLFNDDLEKSARLLRKRTPDHRLDEDAELQDFHAYGEHNGDIPCDRCPICGVDMFAQGWLDEVVDDLGREYVNIYDTPTTSARTYYCKPCHEAVTLVLDELTHTTLDEFARPASVGGRR